MNKKIILLIGSLIFLIIIVIIIFSNTNKESREGALVHYNSEPEFLSEEKKAYFGLAPETKVQVLDYDQGYEIYKIIEDDGELE